MRWVADFSGKRCRHIERVIALAVIGLGFGAASAVAGGPANDECSNASSVTNGTYAITNVGATTDGPDEPGLCNFFGYTQIGADVWYRYVATCTGTATVDLCVATFDTKLAVYGATCPVGAAAIACNDDACGGGGGTRSRVSFAVVSGLTYRIRVGGFNGAQGAGTMTLSCLADGPTNDACADALPIADGATPFNTEGATTDGPAEALCLTFGSDQVTNDVWFRYTAPCSGAATASLCGATFDTRIAVYGDTCPVSAAALVCNDDACGEQSSIAFDALAGTQYLIRVGGYIGATGGGTLTMTCDANPPANDDCLNAGTALLGSTNFTTLGASTDGPAEAICAGGGSDQIDADVWYRFVAPCSGDVLIDLCASNFNTRLAVYDDECPAGAAALGCNDDRCGTPANRSQLTFTAISGNAYLIRIGGFLGATGSGVMEISCPAGACLADRGDANCDGTVDFFDIDPFLLALFDLSAYEATYCDGDSCAADADCSVIVDFFDIDPFLACLFGTCPACP